MHLLPSAREQVQLHQATQPAAQRGAGDPHRGRQRRGGERQLHAQQLPARQRPLHVAGALQTREEEPIMWKHLPFEQTRFRSAASGGNDTETTRTRKETCHVHAPRRHAGNLLALASPMCILVGTFCDPLLARGDSGSGRGQSSKGFFSNILCCCCCFSRRRGAEGWFQRSSLRNS